MGVQQLEWSTMSDDETISNVEKTYKPWQVKPGQVLNPRGRPKGSRNKLGEQFVSALQADFEANGEKVIETVRVERPHEYLKVVASILPKEVKVTTTQVEELSDDELAAGIAALQSIIAAQAAREGAGETGSGEPAQGIPALH